MKWRLLVTPAVRAALRGLPPEIKRYVRRALEDIAKDPDSGKPLRDELLGLHSFRAKRFRIIYRIQKRTFTVAVIAVGHRETIYQDVSIPRRVQEPKKTYRSLKRRRSVK